MKKKIGSVTEKEKNEIQTLFERKNGLAELAKIIDGKNDALYQRLVKDMGENSILFQKWWDEKAQKYGWKGSTNGHWEINFETNEIFLNN